MGAGGDRNTGYIQILFNTKSYNLITSGQTHLHIFPNPVMELPTLPLLETSFTKTRSIFMADFVISFPSHYLKNAASGIVIDLSRKRSVSELQIVGAVGVFDQFIYCFMV